MPFSQLRVSQKAATLKVKVQKSEKEKKMVVDRKAAASPTSTSGSSDLGARRETRKSRSRPWRSTSPSSSSSSSSTKSSSTKDKAVATVLPAEDVLSSVPSSPVVVLSKPSSSSSSSSSLSSASTVSMKSKIPIACKKLCMKVRGTGVSRDAGSVKGCEAGSVKSAISAASPTEPSSPEKSCPKNTGALDDIMNTPTTTRLVLAKWNLTKALAKAHLVEAKSLIPLLREKAQCHERFWNCRVPKVAQKCGFAKSSDKAPTMLGDRPLRDLTCSAGGGQREIRSALKGARGHKLSEPKVCFSEDHPDSITVTRWIIPFLDCHPEPQHETE